MVSKYSYLKNKVSKCICLWAVGINLASYYSKLLQEYLMLHVTTILAKFY